MIRLEFSAAHVEAFARVWPCLGTVSGPLAFEFEASGDLCGVEGDEGLDERAVLALSHDAAALAGLEAHGDVDLGWLPPDLPRPALPPVWSLLAAPRPYACQCCGTVQHLTTNHTGGLSGVCPGCNVRGLDLPTTGRAPYAGRFPRPLTYAGPPVTPAEWNPHNDAQARRRPGMYAGPHNGRTLGQWEADAIAALHHGPRGVTL